MERINELARLMAETWAELKKEAGVYSAHVDVYNKDLMLMVSEEDMRKHFPVHSISGRDNDKFPTERSVTVNGIKFFAISAEDMPEQEAV